MKNLLILLIAYPCLSYAGLEKLNVKNLNLNYTAPTGKATVDKIGIDLSFAPEALEMSVQRTADSFELTSEILDFTWMDPWKFIHDLEKASLVNTHAALGKSPHTVKSDFISLRPLKKKDFEATSVDGICEGTSSGEIEDKIIQDCLNKANIKIKKLDVPTDFFLYQVLDNLPPVLPEANIPGDNVVLTIDKGNFFFQIYVKYWVYAGLRFWGHAEQTPEHYKIRVDEVKFGILNVTKLVMNKFVDIFKDDPKIEVKPPYITISK